MYLKGGTFLAVTNIFDLNMNQQTRINDYYAFFINQGDYQSRTVQANLYITYTKNGNRTAYNLTSETVTIVYEYTDSDGETQTTGEYSCTKATSIGNNVITFLIPSVVVENVGKASAQIKVYEDEYTLLNSVAFLFYISLSINIGSYTTDEYPLLYVEPIIGSIPPTTSTVGFLGQLYVNTASQALYYCSNISAGVYTWSLTTSGAPSGTYADLAALNVADPNHNNIYVTLDDGHWCYYDTGTSEFVSGALYTAPITTAANLPIVDAGGYFDATEVEGALQESAAKITTNTNDIKENTILTELTLIDGSRNTTTPTTIENTGIDRFLTVPELQSIDLQDAAERIYINFTSDGSAYLMVYAIYLDSSLSVLGTSYWSSKNKNTPAFIVNQITQTYPTARYLVLNFMFSSDGTAGGATDYPTTYTIRVFGKERETFYTRAIDSAEHTLLEEYELLNAARNTATPASFTVTGSDQFRTVPSLTSIDLEATEENICVSFTSDGSKYLLIYTMYLDIGFSVLGTSYWQSAGSIGQNRKILYNKTEVLATYPTARYIAFNMMFSSNGTAGGATTVPSNFTIRVYDQKQEDYYAMKNLCIQGESTSTLTETNWPTTLCKRLKFLSVTNVAVGGEKMTGEGTDDMNGDTRMAQIPTDTDVLIINGGLNDWAQEVSLVDLADGMAILFEKIITRIPDALVVFWTPTYWRCLARPGFSADGNTNPSGVSNWDYAQTILETCRRWNIPCVDVWGMCGVNDYNANDYLQADPYNVHPQEALSDRIADILHNYLVFSIRKT